MRLGSFRALVWTALLAVGTRATAGPGSGETMLVLDVSGSMWGRVSDGTKIEVARRAVRALVQDSDRPEALGLVAYGHRRKGDCGDIELLAPVGAGGAIQTAVDGATPVGMTPLTAAVEAAVDQLAPGDASSCPDGRRPATGTLARWREPSEHEAWTSPCM